MKYFLIKSLFDSPIYIQIIHLNKSTYFSITTFAKDFKKFKIFSANFLFWVYYILVYLNSFKISTETNEKIKLHFEWLDKSLSLGVNYALFCTTTAA